MNLLMVRHGEILSNIRKVYAGRSSEVLTEKGIVQAKDAAEKLRKHEAYALYTSPIYRAVQTAEIIKGVIGLDYIIEDSFREMEMGPWEGLSEDEIAISYHKEWEIWQTRPAELKLSGRETLDELLKRVLKGVQNIFNCGGDRSVVVVSHVAVIRVLLLWHDKKSLNLYKTLQIPNAEIIEISIDNCKEKLMFTT